MILHQMKKSLLLSGDSTQMLTRELDSVSSVRLSTLSKLLAQGNLILKGRNREETSLLLDNYQPAIINNIRQSKGKGL